MRGTVTWHEEEPVTHAIAVHGFALEDRARVAECPVTPGVGNA